MYPILVRYGPFFLYSFSVTLALGAVASLALTARLANQQQLPDWLDGILTAAAVALVGGRVGYVLAHASYFRGHSVEAWQLWRGGLSYHGALLAGLAALWAWSRLQQKPFLLYAGLFAPGLALFSAAGWAACWLEGCAYGAETTSGLLSASLADEFGVLAVRYPTQLIGCVLSLAVLSLLLRRWHRWTAGVLFWFTLFCLSLIHGLVGLMRGNPFPLFLGWRVDVWLDSGIALFAMLCFWIAKRAKYNL
jgi:phosphatidylglycerol:prolipoprotein diacylglycerol transferase